MRLCAKNVSAQYGIQTAIGGWHQSIQDLVVLKEESTARYVGLFSDRINAIPGLSWWKPKETVVCFSQTDLTTILQMITTLYPKLPRNTKVLLVPGSGFNLSWQSSFQDRFFFSGYGYFKWLLDRIDPINPKYNRAKKSIIRPYYHQGVSTEWHWFIIIIDESNWDIRLQLMKCLKGLMNCEPNIYTCPIAEQTNKMAGMIGFHQVWSYHDNGCHVRINALRPMAIIEVKEIAALLTWQAEQSC